jgi:hypothetical protein
MDLWAGYNLAMTDDLTVGVGAIRYEFGGQQPQSLPSVEEMYVAGYWKNTNFKYYVDTSNRDLGYLEVSQGLPFIKVLDVKLGYGEFKDGDKHVSLTVEKPLTENLTVGHEKSKRINRTIKSLVFLPLLGVLTYAVGIMLTNHL